jgi:hypothetical protein
MSDPKTPAPAVVKLQIRSSYGVDRIYPVNETARLFVRLTGRKTFLPADLGPIQALGYSVEWIPQTLGPISE